jgi:hypothetical protein
MRRTTNYPTNRRELDPIPVSVTRHAIERYETRGRRYATPRRLEREIADSILAEIDLGALFRVGRGIHLAVFGMDQRRLCAVLGVAGPAEKPFAVKVFTVLTAEMAVATYGHLSGLIEALDERARRDRSDECQATS